MWKIYGYDETCMSPEDYGEIYKTKREARAAIKKYRDGWTKNRPEVQAFPIKVDGCEGYSVYWPGGYEYDIWFSPTNEGKRELVNLVRDRYGNYEATYIDGRGHFLHQNFMYYSKKDVISLLRNEYHVTVGREFC